MFKRLKLVWDEHSEKSVWRRMVLSIGLLSLLVLPYAFSQTYSYYCDRTENKDNAFQSAAIDSFLKISQGKAKAIFPAVGDPSGDRKSICFLKDGEPHLDFGEVVQGNSRNFVDVLRLKNLTTKPLTISWHFIGEISTLLKVTNGSFILLPDEVRTTLNSVYGEVYIPATTSNKRLVSTVAEQYSNPYSMDMDLEIDTEPGTYNGYLIINVNGNFLSVKIPAKVYVREMEKKVLPEVSPEQNSGTGSQSEPDQSTTQLEQEPLENKNEEPAEPTSQSTEQPSEDQSAEQPNTQPDTQLDTQPANPIGESTVQPSVNSSVNPID